MTKVLKLYVFVKSMISDTMSNELIFFGKVKIYSIDIEIYGARAL